MLSSAMKLVLMLIAFMVFAFIIVLGVYLFLKNRKDEDLDSVDRIKDAKPKTSGKSSTGVGGKFHGVLNTDSIYRFMEFEEIIDGMIIRKNRTQFVMILACNGINFDLRSDEEKFAIEEGFQQFLNVIKYPVQLYVQTRGMNYDNLIQGYENRLNIIEADIKESDSIIAKETKAQNEKNVQKETKNKRRKQNIKEYAQDTIKYVNRLSNNQNVLHQKSYVVVSYYISEFGPKISNYSPDEIQDMIFDELFTRCSNLSSALQSSGVTSRVLNSEELMEVLFNAYNRDATEYMRIDNYLDAEYDSLYSTAKEVLEKRKEKLEEEISLDAINLATSSIVQATKKRRAELEKIEKEKKKKIKIAAKKYVEEYRDKLDQAIYETALQNVDEADLEELDKEVED